MLTTREVIKTFYNALKQKLKSYRGNWDQNDPSADDYIKNRPFYTDETKNKICVKERTFIFDSNGVINPNLGYFLVEGETYTVIWDDISYECVARNDGYDAIYIGNQEFASVLMGWDFPETIVSNEPFFIATHADNNWCYIAAVEGTHKISIIQPYVVKIDKKYLPENNSEKIEAAIDDLYDYANYLEYNLSNIPTDTVRYNATQNLTEVQKTRARANIGAVSSSEITGVVKYSEAQNLTNAQKTQARTNIGASSFSGKYDDLTNKPSSVLYTTQSLTSSQKQTARTNIGAGTSSFSGYYNDLKNIPQIDWNATEGNGYIANRPCYDDTIKQYIFENIAYKTKPIYNNTQLYYCGDGMTVEPNKLILGKEYCVKFNGTIYKCTVKKIQGTLSSVPDSLPQDFIYLGNPYYINLTQSGAGYVFNSNDVQHNGMPFAIRYLDTLQKMDINAIESFTNCSMYYEENILKQLDEKYIPDSIKNSIENAEKGPKDQLILIDQVNGYHYILCMRDGNLVTYCAIKSIEIMTMPTKVEYIHGEYFDPNGMVILATMYDGTTKEIVDYTYTTNYLVENSTFVEIKCVDGDIEYIVNVPVTVNAFNAETILMDFNYTDNSDGTYTITNWKGTYNGEPSTEIIVPNYANIII